MLFEILTPAQKQRLEERQSVDLGYGLAGVARFRANVYVHPATHLGGSGPSGTTVPYGSRLRLKSSYNVASIATPGTVSASRSTSRWTISPTNTRSSPGGPV